MNAPVSPEIFARLYPNPQLDLTLGAEGVLRYVWESRFGPILIEVRDGKSYVNGQLVEPVQLSSVTARTGN